MNGFSALKNCSRILAGVLLLAAFSAAAAIGGPAAIASPSRPAAPSRVTHPAHAQSPASGTPNPIVKVTWSEIPSGATKVDSRQRYSYTNIKPGSTIKDYVAIINRGKADAAFSVYGTDATGTSLTDALTFLIAGAKPKDIGSWIQFLPSKASELSLLIPGGHGVIEPFTINVPSFATPGDHTGGMVAQVGVPSRNANGQLIVQYQRIVVPIELRVFGPLRAGLQVRSVSTSFNDSVNPFGTGSASITYSVFNSGNVRLTGTQLVHVTGLFGMSATVKPPALPVILPGDSVQITTTLPGLYPAGLLTAHVTVNPGWPESASALSLPLAVTADSASLFAFPWALFGLIVVLAGGGFGTWRFLRWRRREHQADVAAVAERVRRETERRLLAGRKSAATVGAGPAVTPAEGSSTSADAGEAAPGSGSKAE